MRPWTWQVCDPPASDPSFTPRRSDQETDALIHLLLLDCNKLHFR